MSPTASPGRRVLGTESAAYRVSHIAARACHESAGKNRHAPHVAQRVRHEGMLRRLLNWCCEEEVAE